MPVPILLQAGARKPRPLYNAPGRAFRDLPSLARPKLCPGPMREGVSYVQISVVYIRNIIPIEI
jgi:hypothetical protein